MAIGKEKAKIVPVFQKRLSELKGDMPLIDFSNQLGLSRVTVGFYLHGERVPDITTLYMICNHYDVSSDWLLGLSDIPNPDVGDARVYYIKAAEKEKRLSNLAELLSNVSKEIKEVLNATP